MNQIFVNKIFKIINLIGLLLLLFLNYLIIWFNLTRFFFVVDQTTDYRVYY